jgi:HAD superfamily hydrolase (TIGR01509 family)
VAQHLQAIIFDFDGVIANSEPLHLQAFQQALSEEGIALTPSDYYNRYLGFDDVGVFSAIASDRGVPMTGRHVTALVARKGAIMEAMIHDGSVLFAGVREFVRDAAAEVPIAIASGALKHEIEGIVNAAGLGDLFVTIVASGDTPESKPSPAPYLLAFEKLRAASGRPLDPRRCVAIEDSRWGIESARGAGLRCVGVTTSYPAHQLGEAELIVPGLHGLTIPMLDRLCSGTQ